MAKSDKKRYYWLKLPIDFFDSDAIKWIEEQDNGILYSNFYLKLLLKSVNDNGILIRRVGDMLIPYDIPHLAELTGVNIDTVAVALKFLAKAKLICFVEGELHMVELPSMVGSETLGAKKKRDYRIRQQQQQEQKKIEESKQIANTSSSLPEVMDLPEYMQEEKYVPVSKEQPMDILSALGISDNSK